MIEDDFEALPPRPRRRLLGAGINLGAGGHPITLALLGVLLIACGFIAGVLVEKGQTSTGSAASATGLASRFAALRSAVGTGAGATIGQVAYIDGNTLYVTSSAGNTVKVRTSAGATVTKTVKADVKGIRPGETVAIMGTTSASGTMDAESIRVGGGAGTGIGAPLDGSARSTSGGGEPALFGKGG